MTQPSPEDDLPKPELVSHDDPALLIGMTTASYALEPDLPPGPYRIDGHTVLTEDGTVFAWAHGKTPEQGYAIARAIAAIPEMRATIKAQHESIFALNKELDRLRAENAERTEQINQLAAQLIEAEKYNGWHQQALMECDRLRAEKAAIEAATIERCAKLADAHDPFEGGTEIPVGDAIRALAKENETDGK